MNIKTAFEMMCAGEDYLVNDTDNPFIVHGYQNMEWRSQTEKVIKDWDYSDWVKKGGREYSSTTTKERILRLLDNSINSAPRAFFVKNVGIELAVVGVIQRSNTKNRIKVESILVNPKYMGTQIMKSVTEGLRSYAKQKGFEAVLFKRAKERLQIVL